MDAEEQKIHDDSVMLFKIGIAMVEATMDDTDGRFIDVRENFSEEEIRSGLILMASILAGKYGHVTGKSLSEVFAELRASAD
jgi:hypothetical protein